MTGRRTSSDEKWKEVKDKVRIRDKNICRLKRIVSIKEMMILKKNAPPHMLMQLDPAHVFPVGAHPDYCYLTNNLVMLNHYSHSNLDNMCSPLDGHAISREERDNWWKRIVGEKQMKDLLNDINKLKVEENNEQQ